MRGFQILRPDGRGQPIDTVIRLGRDFIQIVKGIGYQNRPENLFLHYLHMRRGAHQNRWLEEISFPVQAPASSKRFRALPDTAPYIAVHAFQMLF